MTLSDNLKKVLSWLVLFAFFLAAVIIMPSTWAKMVLGLIGLYVLFNYGRTIWQNWEK